MRVEDIRRYKVVLTSPGETCSILAVPSFLLNRKEGTGRVLTPIEGHPPGHWWVEDPEGRLAPYTAEELEESDQDWSSLFPF